MLLAGASVLQLGMETDVDLIELEKYYMVIGSNFSLIFLSKFSNNYSEIQVLEFDITDFLIKLSQILILCPMCVSIIN